MDGVRTIDREIVIICYVICGRTTLHVKITATMSRIFAITVIVWRCAD